MSPRPLVSVVMPLYNTEQYVAAAVRSVLAQTYENLELVVVDDGSSDASIAAVTAVADDRVRVVEQIHGGEAAARNRGLDEARGELVAWLDADDLCLPHRLTTMVDALEATGAAFAHCDLLFIDEQEVPIGLLQSSQISPTRVLPFLLREGTPFNNNTLMMRSEILTGCRHDCVIPFGTDTDFIAQFAPFHTGVHVPEPLILYRRHPASITNAQSPETVRPMVELLLTRYPLRQLVPEAWVARSELESEALACALVALRLVRRGFADAAVGWLQRLAGTGSGQVAPVVLAVASMAAGDHTGAGRALASCRPDDPVALNLEGEILVCRGQLGAASYRFRQALLLAPDYGEALSNLMGLGGRLDLRAVNPDARRFAG
jgi:hypothetical protein